MRCGTVTSALSVVRVHARRRRTRPRRARTARPRTRRRRSSTTSSTTPSRRCVAARFEGGRQVEDAQPQVVDRPRSACSARPSAISQRAGSSIGRSPSWTSSIDVDARRGRRTGCGRRSAIAATNSSTLTDAEHAVRARGRGPAASTGSRPGRRRSRAGSSAAAVRHRLEPVDAEPSRPPRPGAVDPARQQRRARGRRSPRRAWPARPGSTCRTNPVAGGCIAAPARRV